MSWIRSVVKVKRAIQIVIGGGSLMAVYSTYSGNEHFYRHYLMPCMRLIDAEKSHRMAVFLASKNIVPQIEPVNSEKLNVKLWNLKFSGPVGLAAGFDKNGAGIDGLFRIGFDFIEIGSITPEPQEGNPLPRVFRLNEDKAIINRYGFNSEGHDAVKDRLKLRKFLNKNRTDKILGINLGKNKTSPDAVKDYVDGVKKFGEFADYLVINVSSPNTPGLRALQGRKLLKELLSKVVEARNDLPLTTKPPLLIKVAPDLTDDDKVDIAAVICEKDSRVDGLIVSNTTLSRPETLKSRHKNETGGLSGKPLQDKSTQVIFDFYKLTSGRVPIIGVGGVSSGSDAYEKIQAGASLIQLYTAFAYEGPPLANKIKRELVDLMSENNVMNITEVIGESHRLKSNSVTIK